mmetsp:Transcript_105077/g.250120  ORF Transcript_105077/g.250120 Transcript_105077/m.250120 type:complete len:594 (+) Transcript_105077:68-1849(+)
MVRRWLCFALLGEVLAIREESEATRGLKVKPAARENETAYVYENFDKFQLHAALNNLVSMPVELCGSRLKAVEPVDDALEHQIRTNPGKFFVPLSSKDNDGNSIKAVYAAGVGWRERPGRKAVLGRLLQVGKVLVPHYTKVEDLAGHLLHRTGKIRTLTFDVGTDLRDCWGQLRDPGNRLVCDAQNIRDLMEDVIRNSAELDSAGKSGASIVTNMRRFVVKNFKDAENPYIVRQVMPTFARKLTEHARADGGCFRTAVAPLCAVLDLPKADDSLERTHWHILRKVELEEESTSLVFQDNDRINFLDLKGPKFSGWRDGKSWLGSAEDRHRKDAGFTELFPSGLPLAPCGAKEAARALELDSEMLRDTDMTDYSLFMVPYTATSEPRCGCDPAVPQWPLVLDAEPAGKQYRFAVGIIDYLERSVHGLNKVLHFSMSTMRTPTVYRNWWMLMWPMYFHIPPFSSTPQGQITPPAGSGLVEQLTVGQRVVAVEKIKWRRHSEKITTRGNEVRKCYQLRLFETSSRDSSSGSAEKVYAGSEGTILQLTKCNGEGPGIVVMWDDTDQDEVFEVGAEQIMGLPRRLVEAPPAPPAPALS